MDLLRPQMLRQRLPRQPPNQPPASPLSPHPFLPPPQLHQLRRPHLCAAGVSEWRAAYCRPEPPGVRTLGLRFYGVVIRVEDVVLRDGLDAQIVQQPEQLGAMIGAVIGDLE